MTVSVPLTTTSDGDLPPETADTTDVPPATAGATDVPPATAGSTQVSPAAIGSTAVSPVAAGSAGVAPAIAGAGAVSAGGGLAGVQPADELICVPVAASGDRELIDALEKLLHHKLGDHLVQVERTVEHHVKHAIASGREHAHAAADVCAPAWLRRTAGEPRWPVMLAILAAIGLQESVPARFAISPQWLLPVLEGGLLLVLIIANPGRINRHDRRWVRNTSLALVALATVATAFMAGRLIYRLVEGQESDKAGPLLLTGGAIWLTNVIIFALWYWEFDRGGPAARAHALHTFPDFQFPQMSSPDTSHPDWEPAFADYLYVSFTNATAFSPTDTVPMTRWAKLLMVIQSCISLATVALVIARAVNVL